MYRYRSEIKTTIIHDLGRWGNRPEFGVEAKCGDDRVRIELDRGEALKLRQALTLYLKATAPPKKVRR